MSAVDVENPALDMPYNCLPKRYRLLWHQTLNTVLRYPEIPRETINFDFYPFIKNQRKQNITLGSSVVTTYSGTIEDFVVTEKWPADQLSIRAGFFYELYRFANALLDSDDFLFWYPADKTEKVFAIHPVDIFAGSSSEYNVNPVHNIGENNYRWLDSEVQFKFKIERIFDVPNAFTFLDGA